MSNGRAVSADADKTARDGAFFGWIHGQLGLFAPEGAENEVPAHGSGELDCLSTIETEAVHIIVPEVLAKADHIVVGDRGEDAVPGTFHAASRAEEGEGDPEGDGKNDYADEEQSATIGEMEIHGFKLSTLMRFI